MGLAVVVLQGALNGLYMRIISILKFKGFQGLWAFYVAFYIRLGDRLHWFGVGLVESLRPVAALTHRVLGLWSRVCRFLVL